MKAMLVGTCSRCGRPAHLRCAVCGRTVCRSCLDEDERICQDCRAREKATGTPGLAHPPSRSSRR